MQDKKKTIQAVNYKWIIDIAAIGMAIISVGSMMNVTFKNLKEEKERANDYERPALEKIMPSNSASDAQCMGKIYTLDGKRMTNRYYYKGNPKSENETALETNPETTDEVNTEANNETSDELPPLTERTYTEYDFDVEAKKREGTDFATRFSSDEDDTLSVPTEVYYSTITGTEYSGLLYDAKGILKSQAGYANKLRSEGNHILTTIHSDAQRVAYEQIKEYTELFKSHYTTASISVVSADGAILVDVSSNMQYAYDYMNGKRDYYKGIHYRKNEENEDVKIPYSEFYDIPDNWSWNYDYGLKVPNAVGSSFKPISARVLLKNDDLLGEEFSLYNNYYKDVNISSYSDDGIYQNENIYNHDYSIPDDQLIRSLSVALQFSSNTYFLDHVKALSMDKYLEGLRDLFDLDAYENMGTYVRPPLLMSKNDPNYNKAEFEYIREMNYGKLTYGQEAKLSTISLASLYNTAISGNYFHPFIVSKVYSPDYDVLYEYNTLRNVRKVMDIDIKNDILVKALSDTYISYVEYTSYSYSGMLENTKRPLGRFLAKSGTADVLETGDYSTSTCNHTMVLTVLSEDCTQVICTAVIAVNNLPNSMDSKTNADYVKMLTDVVNELEVI